MAAIAMRVTFTPGDKSHSVSPEHVHKALDTILSQIDQGASAGQLRLNGNHSHMGESCSVGCVVKWSLDGDLEM